MGEERMELVRRKGLLRIALGIERPSVQKWTDRAGGDPLIAKWEEEFERGETPNLDEK